MSSLECPRCGAALTTAVPSCAVCGGANVHWDDSVAIAGGLSPQLNRQARSVLQRGSNRFGLIPLVAVLGLLPFYPITPLIGIVAGTVGLRRVWVGVDPAQGRTPALAGLVGGMFWITVGLVLTTRAARFIQSTPFIPEPLKWFWSWPVGG